MRRMAMMIGALALGAALVATSLSPVQAGQVMTEADYDAMMKRVAPAFGGLRKAIEASAAEQAAEQAAVLRQAFTETEGFWKARGKDEAVALAVGARAAVDAVHAQTTAGNWEAAGTAAGELQGFCAKCHGAYRDKAEDGTWRIKPD